VQDPYLNPISKALFAMEGKPSKVLGIGGGHLLGPFFYQSHIHNVLKALHGAGAILLAD
jgi:hypothetical protein